MKGKFASRWVSRRLSKTHLGKYIVLYASLLHLIWAGLLIFSPDPTNATPVSILVRTFGGRFLTALVLVAVATLALSFLLGRRASNRRMALFLIPQQVVLLLSAGAGLSAVIVQHYADGVLRPWSFIFADQLPNILTALLYTVAILETTFVPPDGPLDDKADR